MMGVKHLGRPQGLCLGRAARLWRKAGRKDAFLFSVLGEEVRREAAGIWEGSGLADMVPRLPAVLGGSQQIGDGRVGPSKPSFVNSALPPSAPPGLWVTLCVSRRDTPSLPWPPCLWALHWLALSLAQFRSANAGGFCLCCGRRGAAQGSGLLSMVPWPFSDQQAAPNPGNAVGEEPSFSRELTFRSLVDIPAACSPSEIHFSLGNYFCCVCTVDGLAWFLSLSCRFDVVVHAYIATPLYTVVQTCYCRARTGVCSGARAARPASVTAPTVGHGLFHWRPWA